MTDSKKSKRPAKSARSRSKASTNAHARLNVANIVQRLPFHQHLSNSQSLILQAKPIWHAWCEQQRKLNDSKQFAATNDATLTSFDEGVLSLACGNTTTATTLKHKQASLLEAFQEAGFKQIKRIQVRMTLTKHNYQSQNYKSQTDSHQPGNHSFGGSRESLSNLQPSQQSHHQRDKPSDSSIKSVEAVTNRVKNEHLAEALQRLAETLKKQ